MPEERSKGGEGFIPDPRNSVDLGSLTEMGKNRDFGRMVRNSVLDTLNLTYQKDMPVECPGGCWIYRF